MRRLLHEVLRSNNPIKAQLVAGSTLLFSSQSGQFALVLSGKKEYVEIIPKKWKFNHLELKEDRFGFGEMLSWVFPVISLTAELNLAAPSLNGRGQI